MSDSPRPPTEDLQQSAEHVAENDQEVEAAPAGADGQDEGAAAAAATKLSKRPSRKSSAAATTSSPAEAEDGDRRKRSRKVADHSYPNEEDREAQRKAEAAQIVALSPELRACEKVLRQVMDNVKLSWPFLEPVDPIALKIPDYPEIIKHPMDLGTVKSKLLAGSYLSCEEFSADVLLVVTNCVTYNPPASDISNMARELQTFFEKRFQQQVVERLDTLRTPEPVRSASSRSAGPAAVASVSVAGQPPPGKKRKVSPGETEVSPGAGGPAHAAKQKKGGVPVSGAALLSGKPAPATQRQGAGAGRGISKQQQELEDMLAAVTPETAFPMTYEEKRVLTNKIQELSEDQLLEVARIVTTAQAQYTGTQQGDDEIEIDMEKLDSVTLRRLEKFTAWCLKKKKDRLAKMKAGASAPDYAPISLESQTSGAAAVKAETITPKFSAVANAAPPLEVDDEGSEHEDAAPQAGAVAAGANGAGSGGFRLPSYRGE